MRSSEFKEAVNLPEVADFLTKYSRYSSLVAGEGRLIYEQIMQPEVFIKARVISEIDLPAVLAVADACKTLADANNNIALDNFTKQFVGSVVCTLMEANGYKKSGKKKRVPHPAFTVGEFYVKA